VTLPDDATLARAAQAGDASGLGALFERHRARLHAVAVGMLGHGPTPTTPSRTPSSSPCGGSVSCASRPPPPDGSSPSWSTSAAPGCAARP
jgi:hypothetical protein